MTQPSGRLSRLIKRSLDAVMTPAADPRRATTDPLQRQREALLQVRQAAVDLAAARQRLAPLAAATRGQIEDLRGAARQALLDGREDVARSLLARRRSDAADLARLDHQLAAIEREEQRLLAVEQRLASRIAAIQARHHLIAARYRAADEEETASLQARAAAIERMVADGLLEPPAWLGREANRPAAPAADDTHDVERQLAALKQELGRA
jgi:phage shock protein A